MERPSVEHRAPSTGRLDDVADASRERVARSGSRRCGRESEYVRVVRGPCLDLIERAVEMRLHGAPGRISVVGLEGIEDVSVLAMVLGLALRRAQQEHPRAVEASARRLDRGPDAVVSELGQEEIMEPVV